MAKRLSIVMTFLMLVLSSGPSLAQTGDFPHSGNPFEGEFAGQVEAARARALVLTQAAIRMLDTNPQILNAFSSEGFGAVRNHLRQVARRLPDLPIEIDYAAQGRGCQGAPGSLQWRTLAYVDPLDVAGVYGRPVHICPLFFEAHSEVLATTLVHETMHTLDHDEDVADAAALATAAVTGFQDYQPLTYIRTISRLTRVFYKIWTHQRQPEYLTPTGVRSFELALPKPMIHDFNKRRFRSAQFTIEPNGGQFSSIYYCKMVVSRLSARTSLTTVKDLRSLIGVGRPLDPEWEFGMLAESAATPVVTSFAISNAKKSGLWSFECFSLIPVTRDDLSRLFQNYKIHSVIPL